MISKSSLVNQIKHNIGRRIWVFAILMLGFFVTLPLFYLGRISQLTHVFPIDTVNQISHFLRFDAFTPNGNYYSTFVVVFAAIICGITSFCYLNSKSQVDLYHSMPIIKKTLFIIRLISGYLLFLVPFLGNLLISSAIAVAQSGVNGFQWSSLWKLFLVDNVYFLQIYLLTSLAVILTGNMLNNVIMTIAVLCGEGFGMMVFRNLQEMFFSSYSGMSPFPSAVTPVSDMMIRMGMKEYENCIDIYPVYFGKAGHFYGLLLGTAVLFVLTMFVFCKRPSESSGKAVVFGKVEWVLKAYFTVLLTFTGASFCRDVFVQGSAGWFIFGAVASFVLSHIVLEVLFRADFRAAFHHIWHWGVNLCIAVLIFCAFQFDWFSYDSYIPKEKKVESVAISFDGLDEQIDYSSMFQQGINKNWRYISNEAYRLEHMKLTELSKVYELVEYAVAHGRTYSPWGEYDSHYAQYDRIYNMEKEDIVSALEEVRQDSNQWCRIQTELEFTIKYHLYNGKEIYRNYYIDITDEQVLSLIGSIYDQSAFKLAEYPVLSDTESDSYISSITVASFAGYTTKKLSEEQVSKLLEVYRTDLMNMSFEEMKNEQGLGHLTFDFVSSVDNGYRNVYYGASTNNPIYPSFTGTISYLSELGVPVYADFDNIEFTKVKVSTAAYYEREASEYIYPAVEYDVKDYEKIQEILGSCDWKYNTQNIWGGMMLLDVEIEYKNKVTGETSWEYGEFLAGETPDFVLEDMIRGIQ